VGELISNCHRWTKIQELHHGDGRGRLIPSLPNIPETFAKPCNWHWTSKGYSKEYKQTWSWTRIPRKSAWEQAPQKCFDDECTAAEVKCWVECHQRERKTVRFSDGPPKCSFSGQQNLLEKWLWVIKCKKKELTTELWLSWKKECNFMKETKEFNGKFKVLRFFF